MCHCHLGYRRKGVRNGNLICPTKALWKHLTGFGHGTTESWWKSKGQNTFHWVKFLNLRNLKQVFCISTSQMGNVAIHSSSLKSLTELGWEPSSHPSPLLSSVFKALSLTHFLPQAVLGQFLSPPQRCCTLWIPTMLSALWVSCNPGCLCASLLCWTSRIAFPLCFDKLQSWELEHLLSFSLVFSDW